MTERIVTSLPNPSGKWRFVVVQRDDGAFSYRMQVADGEHWGPSGLHAGIYDSAETAEVEAWAKMAEGKFPDTLVWTPELSPDGRI